MPAGNCCVPLPVALIACRPHYGEWTISDPADGHPRDRGCGKPFAMRRLLFLVMLIVAIGAVAPSASASASSDIDGVTGVGTLGQLGDPTVRVSAVQIGSAAIGGFRITYPDRTFAAGRATCLFVAGNTAYLTGRIIRSGGPRSQVENWLRGSYIVIGV